MLAEPYNDRPHRVSRSSELYIDIDQDRLADAFYLRYYALQVERFGEHDFEDLLYID